VSGNPAGGGRERVLAALERRDAVVRRRR